MTNPFVGNDLRTSSQRPTNPFRGNEVRGPDLTPELEVVTAQAEKSNPERTARALDLSRRTQLPADVVERNLDEVERLAGTRTFDPGQFASEYPTTARWLTNPTNAAVAKDDYDTLGDMERIVGRWQAPRLREVIAGIAGGPTAFGRAAPIRVQAGLVEESFRQGQLGIQLARVYANTTPAQRNRPEVRQRIDALKGQLRQLPESEGIVERALRSAAGGFLPSMVEIGAGGLVGGAAGGIAGGLAGAVGGPVAGVTATGGATIGATAGAFNAARELWSGEMGRALDEVRDEMGNPLPAATQEVVKHTFGVAGGMFEVAGLGIITGRIASAVGTKAVASGVERGVASALRQQTLGRVAVEAGKTYATTVGVETAEETLSEGLQITGEAVARMLGNVQGGQFSPVERETERLMETMVETFYGSLVLGGVAAGGQSIVGLAQYQQAVNEAQRFAAMVGVADASKLRQRDPISFANVVNEQLRTSGNPETVGVPAERMVMLLQEQNVPLEQFAEQAGVTPEAVQDAVAAGQDVMLPVANLLANLTQTPVFQAMQEDIRYRVGLPTLREAKEAEANLTAELESVRKEVEAAVKETPEGGVQRIVEDITAQVTAASATLPKSADYTPENIKAMAEGAAAFYKVMAGRQGVDPYDLYRRRNYRIVGPEQAADIFAQRGGLAQVQPVTREEADTYYAREAHDLRARFPDWSARDIAENMVAAVRQVERWLSQPKPEMTPEAENSVMLRLAFGPMMNQDAFVTTAERADFLAQGGADPNAFIIPGVSQTTIGLMRTADLSSVLHELSHDWLLIVQADAARPDASEQVKQDWATITQYLGLPESGEISVEAQEKWARTWERYAATAEAPSRGLARAFVRFRSWMANVYRRVREMLLPVSDDIAGVFDRILATEDELRVTRQRNGVEPLVASVADAETLGMTPEQYRDYAKGWQLDEAEQNAALLKDLLAERSDEFRKVRREAEATFREEVTAEFASVPVYQAIRYLTTGEIPPGVQMVGGEKLNREAVEVAFGADITKSLPRGIFTDEGGIDADALALAFGFRDGFAVIEAMQQAVPEKQAITAEVRRRMAEAFPDPMQNSAVLTERAQAVAHRATTDDPIVRDLTLLAKSAGIRPPNVPAIKAVAREMVSRMAVKDIRPVAYQNAEATAARKSGEAFKAGNLERAAFHKRQQLLNHILYREARKAVERTDVIARFAKRMRKSSTQERLGRASMAYQNAMNAVLAAYSYIPTFTVGKTAALAAFVEEAVEVAGAVPSIPKAVAEREGQVQVRDITMAELDAVYSTMQQVYQVAAQSDRALQESEKRTMAEMEEQVVASIADKHELSPRNIDSYPLSLTNAKEKLAAIDAWHLPPEFLFVWLDGDTTGTAYNAFFKPFALAEADEFKRGEAAFKEMQRIEKMIELPPWALDRSQSYRGIRTRMTKRAVLSLALNMGTRSGVEAALAAQVDGLPQFGSYADVQAMFAQVLTEQDWKYIQAKWDYANTFWPEIAELERVTNGIVPQKLEAEPFSIRTADGKDIIVKGGYYPLKYNTNKLGIGGALRDVRNSIATDEMTIMSVGAARAQTLHGWTEEREKASGRPLDLSLNVWNAHIVNVIHDLTHRKAVRDVVRLYQRKGVRQAIEQSAGQAAYNSLKPWLARIANPNQVFDNSPIESTFAHARAGVTMVNMGLSVGVSMIQPLGYLQSVDMIGPKWLAQGILAAYSPSWKSIAGAAVGGAAYGATLGPLGVGLGAGFGAFVGGLSKATEFVLENSVAMRQRREDFNRDARDYARTRQGKFSNFDRFYFSFIGMMDSAVMVPTWIGAYRKAMAENGGKHDDAVQFADSAVRRSQGAGSPKDLSRIQGGPELRRMLTIHYSFLSRQYGLVRRSATNLAEGRWGVARTFASMTAIIALSQILSELVAGRGPDDDESWLEWATAETVRAAFSPVVFVRDIARAIGPDAYQYKLSPVVDVLAKTVGSLNTVLESFTEEDFELSEAEAKELVETAGYWGKLPTRAVWRAVTAWQRWMEGYEVPAADFIRTPSR